MNHKVNDRAMVEGVERYSPNLIDARVPNSSRRGCLCLSCCCGLIMKMKHSPIRNLVDTLRKEEQIK